MAHPSRGRARFDRTFAPGRRSATHIEGQARRQQRVMRWRERFRRFSLSAWQSSRIVESVCALFRMSGGIAGTSDGFDAAQSSIMRTSGSMEGSTQMESTSTLCARGVPRRSKMSPRPSPRCSPSRYVCHRKKWLASIVWMRWAATRYKSLKSQWL